MKTSSTSSIPAAPKTRRAFIGNCALLAGSPLLLNLPVNAFAAPGTNTLKVGLIGGGGRGKGAVANILKADANVQLWAIAELFQDRLDRARSELAKKSPRSNVPQERCFSGFDAYKQVIASGVDIIIDASPPHFRPIHTEAAVEKGIHVFAEKPGATDPAGCRKLIAAGELAAQKGVSIVAGTQRRHQAHYVETIRRIKEGQIGDLVSGQFYWMGASTDGFWPHQKRKPNWTEMEYQARNWYAFTWLCGDHIVEQHVHNLDIMLWAFGGPPVKAFGMGGRQRRNWGNIWDHFAVEFEFANGARASSYCRQIDGTSGRVSEALVGTKGNCRLDTRRSLITGDQKWESSGSPDPYVQEHKDLINAIRNNKPVNEARSLAESTLTGILGRLSAYTGKEIKYNWVLEASKLDFTLPAYNLEATPPPADIAMPGKTQAV